MYSSDFQLEVLSLLCHNLEFSLNYVTFIDHLYFDSKEHKIIFRCIASYIQEYEQEIDEKNLKMVADDFMTKKSIDGNDFIAVMKEIGRIFNLTVKNEKFVVDKLVEFVTSQRLKNAIIKSVDVLERGDNYQDVLKLVDEALSVGVKLDSGLCFNDFNDLTNNIKITYDSSRIVRTGFTTFDSAMMGGISSEEVHVIQGKPKDGKSTIACNIGAFAALCGKNVFHVSGEIKKLDVMIKYACRLTGMSYSEIFKCDIQDYQQKMARFYKLSPNLFINSWPEGYATMLDVRAWISRIRSTTGVSPDLIILDYDDCFRPAGIYQDGDLYGNSGKVYDDMIGLASYMKCGILTFAQPKREAWGKPEIGEMITAADITHSAKKIMKCFSVSSLNFKKDSDDGVLYLDLARRGSSHVKIPIKKSLYRAIFQEI